MKGIRSVFNEPQIGAILRAGWIVPFVLSFQFAIAAPTAQASSTPDQATSTSQSKKFEVEWSAPKFIKLVDNKHGRILILGKAKPGTKIELQKDAVSIESQTKVHDLTKSEMNPTPKEISVGSNGRFKMLLTLPFTHVQIPFKATAADEKNQYYILTMLIRKNRPPILVGKTHKSEEAQWQFGLEGRSVTFSQTNLNNLNETMLAVDISYERTFAKRWSVVAQSFIDIAGNAPFSTGQELPSHYWHLNSDLVYHLPIRLPKWRIGIAGGFYYMTMFSSGTKFGYSDLWGPELYPIVTYSLNPKNALSFYLKYSPNASNFSPNFNNHEAATGAEWTKLYQNKRSITFKVEFLQDAFSQSGLSTQSNAINFGVLFGWL